MNRIEQRMQACSAKKEKACITYITAGLPDIQTTKEIIKAQERGGCDDVEIGVPFSDPVADGPVIQKASYRAICGGVTVKKIFDMTRELREEGVEVPIVFMLYYNTILRYGVEAFAKKCNETGVDGLIVPDLPIEEQEELNRYLTESDATILIQLVSPVSAGRISKILAQARGFVYCVSSMGVTGQGAAFHKELKKYLEDVRSATKLPLMMGFGIRSAQDVAPIRNLIDGAIVGSHFITLLEKNDFAAQAAEEYCSTFKAALNA